MKQIYLEGCNRHYARIDFSAFCEGQSSLGREEIEVWGAAPHLFLDQFGNNDAEKLKQKLDQYGLTCRTFTPKGYRYNLGEYEDPQVRKWSMDYFKECMKAASILEADKMLLYLPSVIRDGDPYKAKKVFMENIKELSACAAGYHLAIVLGGTSAFAKDLPEFIKLIKEIEDPSIKSFLETENLLYSGCSIKEWLDTLKDTLIHIHFADACYAGGRIIGEGILPMKRYWKEIADSGYGGSLSFFLTEFSYEQAPFLISERQEEEWRRLRNA